MLSARTPTSHPQLLFFTALLSPAVSKVHSDAGSGHLNLHQSLVSKLVMLNLFLLFVPQYILIYSHPRPLQPTLPQYIGLDVHPTNMPQFQTRSTTLTTKVAQLRCAFCVFSCEAPCQASSRPLPRGLESNPI